MAQYYVAYSKNISHKYKANLKSNVTVFLILNSLFCFLLPLIFSYNSHGFWIKEDSFREQPIVQFKYQYLIILESTISHSHFTLICTTYQQLQFKYSLDKCSLFKVIEQDENEDGKNDKMKMVLHITNVSTHEINAIHLFLVFDYKIHSECILAMEVLTTTSYAFSQAIGKLEIISEFSTHFQKPISCTDRYMKSNYSTILTTFIQQKNKIDSIYKLLSRYSSNSVNVNLKNLHHTKRYKTETAANEPLIVTADIRYTPQEIIYKTRFWQLMKWAWMQYFSILALFIFLSRKTKRFVFQNRILQTIKTNPSED